VRIVYRFFSFNCAVGAAFSVECHNKFLRFAIYSLLVLCAVCGRRNAGNAQEIFPKAGLGREVELVCNLFYAGAC
jgi:hypothetical protein